MNKLSRRNAAVVAFFLFCAVCLLVISFLLSGSTTAEVLPSVQVLSDPREEYLPLLLQEQDGNALLVCAGENGTLLLCLDSVTGQVLLQQESEALSSWAAVRGTSLFVLADSPAGASLVAFASNTLSENSRSTLPFHPDKLLQFDCDRTGTVYYTLADSPAVLRIFSPSGTETEQEFSAPVEFLETAEDSSLLVFAEEKLFYARQGGSLQAVPCLAPPCKRLNDTLFVDQDGIVSALETDEAGIFLSPLFRCFEQFSDAFSFCLDGENCLILSNGTTVLRYDMDGQNRGSCHLASAPLAICPAGAVLREKNNLHYSAFSFEQQDVPFEPFSSSSESTPTPDAEKTPFEVEGQYILMPVGSTAAELREYFKPETVEICDLIGRQITQGNLATGMTVGDWFIVIEGDCNGTGTISSADLRAALALFLESPEITNAKSRAADLNRSGEIDTEDLLRLSRLLGK